MPPIPVIWRLRQEDHNLEARLGPHCEFQGGLGYIVRAVIKLLNLKSTI